MKPLSSLREWLRRARYFLRRDLATRDLEEEMRLHVELRAEAVRRAQDGGAPSLHDGGAQSLHESAEAVAHRKFGNVTNIQQRSRDAWGFAGIESFRGDVQFAFRRLWKQRGFSGAVIVVMAIGIGATTAMFSAVDATLLRPLPFHEPERLAILDIAVPLDRPASKSPSRRSGVDIIQAREMHDLFSDVAAYSAGGLNLSEDDHPLRVNAGVVSANFFRTLGVLPAIGRAFVDAEGVPNEPHVVVLSHGLWQRQYGGRDITGLTITLNKRTYQVIGVMPRGFGFPQESDLWIPMAVPNTIETFEAFRDFVRKSVIARIADGVSLRDASMQLLARSELAQPKTPQLEKMFASIRARGGLATPLQTTLSLDRRTVLFELLGATAMLLLIACANVMNLLLAQASVRRREIVVRQVLGATRLRIVRQLLTESVILSLAGAIVGIVLSMVTLQALGTLLPPSMAGITSLHLDGRMLAFAAMLAVASGVIFGLWPAIGSARKASAETIKSGNGHGATAANASRVRRILVGAELALTVVLLIGAGVMLQSLANIAGRDTGIRIDHVGTMELAFPMSVTVPERRRAIQAVVEHLSQINGVTAAGASKTLPLATAGQLLVGIDVPGFDTTTVDRSKISMTFEDASPGYFAGMGITLLQGRLFTPTEGGSGPQVAVVNATLAKSYWPGTSAIGKVFRMSSDTALITVVGVVNDVPNTLDEEPTMQVYHPLNGEVPFVASIVARGAMPNGALLKAMVSAVREVDPSQPVFHLRTMGEIRDGAITPRRTNAEFILIFALLALVLASVGVYAVVSYSVAQRHRELGIRSALGATGTNLAVLISREMTWTVACGIAAGVWGAWLGARFLESLVYGINVHDTLTFVAVPIALLIPTAVATLIPARRALRINPAVVMRSE